MAHIVSFKIEGLAGRKEPLELELNRDTNIMFGLNGSGKTSLLKILHGAMSNETDILARVPFTSAEVKIYSIDRNKVFTRSIEKTRTPRATQSKSKRMVPRGVRIDNESIVAENLDRNEEMKWACKPATSKEDASTRWRHEYLPTSRLHISDETQMIYSIPSLPQNRGMTEDQLDTFFAHSVEQLWIQYSAQVLSDVRKAQEQGLVSILRAVLSPEKTTQKRKNKFTSKTAYEKVQDFLKRQGSAVTLLGTRKAFEKRYAEDTTLQGVVQDIEVVENSIKSAMTSRDSLQELITRMFTANKKIRFTDKSIEVDTLSGEKIGLASLSSGEKHILKILVHALLIDESSLMIDEPELSMHVDWQKNLIRSLRSLNPDTQLILATHSPEIMADISDDKIFRI